MSKAYRGGVGLRHTQRVQPATAHPKMELQQGRKENLNYCYGATSFLKFSQLNIPFPAFKIIIFLTIIQISNKKKRD